MAKRLRLKSETGVVVTRVEPGSPAADAGIQTGDIIREVNRKAVKNVDDLVQKLEQTKDQNNILLLVQRGQIICSPLSNRSKLLRYLPAAKTPPPPAEGFSLLDWNSVNRRMGGLECWVLNASFHYSITPVLHSLL